MSEYALVLIYAGAIPFLISFWPGLKFYRNSKSLILATFLILVIFGLWDIFATWRGHWYFNPAGVWCFRIINLPLEEVLFFIVIPFCCIFTWETVNYLKNQIK